MFKCFSISLINLILNSLICTIIKFRLNITNKNRESMYTTKQSFPTNGLATILHLLTHFDLDSVLSRLTWIMFNIAKFYPFFLLAYLNSDVFPALHDKGLRKCI